MSSLPKVRGHQCKLDNKPTLSPGFNSVSEDGYDNYDGYVYDGDDYKEDYGESDPNYDDYNDIYNGYDYPGVYNPDVYDGSGSGVSTMTS